MTGRYQDAVDAFTSALEINPADITAWNDKAAALRRLGRDGEAEFCTRKVIEISRNRGPSLVL